MKRFSILLMLMFSITLITNAQNGKRNAAKVNLDSGDIVKAKEFIDEAVAHEKTIDNAETWLYYGEIYAQIGASTDSTIKKLDCDALNKSLKAYQKVVTLDPKNTLYLELSTNVLKLANTFYANGIVYFEAESYEKAIDLFEKTSLTYEVIDVTDTTSVYATALAASNGGIDDVAIAKYQQLIEMGYENSAIYSDLSNVYKKQEKFAEAEKVLAAGREKFPNDNGIIIAEINILLGQGRFEEVITKLKKSIELEPKNASLYLALADSYKETKNREEAINYYEQALEIDPEYFLALYNLGVVYYTQAFDLNLAANDLPFDETAKYKTMIEEANVFFLKGQPYFERAYAIDAEDPDVLKALRQIYTSTKQMEKLEELNKM